MGFELSECCKLLLDALTTRGYNFEQFILSPKQFGIPNERPRYYLIAERKVHCITHENVEHKVLTNLPRASTQSNYLPLKLELYLEKNLSEEIMVRGKFYFKVIPSMI